MQVDFKGGKIVYEVEGKGRAVVLLHGFLESKNIWRDYISQLSSSKRVIAIDLPGHGLSSCFGYLHTMELMAEAVNAVLIDENIRKAVFVGHSMGGYVALAFAEMFPDKVKGLNLFFSTAQADTIAKKEARLQAIDLVKQNHKSFIRKAIPMLFRAKNRKIFKQEINALKEEALKTPKQGIIAALRGMRERPDREILLQFCPYPVLFTIGKYDPALDSNDLLNQAQSGENTQYKLFNDIGHMGFIEAKEECFKSMRQFINKCY